MRALSKAKRATLKLSDMPMIDLSAIGDGARQSEEGGAKATLTDLREAGSPAAVMAVIFRSGRVEADGGRNGR